MKTTINRPDIPSTITLPPSSGAFIIHEDGSTEVFLPVPPDGDVDGPATLAANAIGLVCVFMHSEDEHMDAARIVADEILTSECGSSESPDSN
jgi:hypothetical protein